MAESIDIAVVGGGLAGLTAAAGLACEGQRVAVFEQHSKLGGYAQYFGNEPTYEAATHLLGGCGARGWTRAALEEVGVWDRVDLLPLDPVYQTVFPEHQFTASADPNRFRHELAALWPGEVPGIERFFTEMEAIGTEYLKLVDGPVAEGVLAKYHGKSMTRLLDECTRTEELRAALSCLWLFGGLPPDRLSVLHYGMMWHTFHNQGSVMVKGGIRHLSQALADVITERGGTVETRMGVEKILRNRGIVTGVRLQDGREFNAGAVICTASPYDTFEELLAVEGQTPAGYPPLRGFVASISAIQVHLLVDGPLEPAARTTLLHNTYDLADAYLDVQREEPEFEAMVCTVLDHGDPDRTPAGQHQVALYTLCPYSRYDNWHVPFDMRRTKAYRELPEYRELKERLGDAMVERAEDLFPGLGERVKARKVATPLSMERYTGNTGGAAFGWANIPEQCGANRPSPETPFKNLYMAGHWTFPGGTLAGAITSGRIAAKTVLVNG